MTKYQINPNADFDTRYAVEMLAIKLYEHAQVTAPEWYFEHDLDRDKWRRRAVALINEPVTKRDEVSS